MRTCVIVRFSFESLHRWAGAPPGSTEWYLVNFHRHMFHVEARKEVSHNDRDIEFIGMRRHMLEVCRNKWGEVPHGDSCEMIAEFLVVMFELHSCAVFEDGENGAEVQR